MGILKKMSLGVLLLFDLAFIAITLLLVVCRVDLVGWLRENWPCLLGSAVIIVGTLWLMFSCY